MADRRATPTGWDRTKLGRRASAVGAVAVCTLLLAACSSQPTRYGAASSGARFFDARLGVYSSPRLIADGEPVPRGGGTYLVGHPYTIAGRAYYPNERPDGYSVVGTASWYGDAFHGRRTANGEIFDKDSISAAHPTLPLPSYVRVTNLGNGHSMIVRVNDRGPYHGGRVMDVSQRVAEALSFKGQGTARIRVDYIGRAGLGGSDDGKLMATLRTDGGAAQLDGSSAEPSLLADSLPPPPPVPHLPDPPVAMAQADDKPRFGAASGIGTPSDETLPPPAPPRRRGALPVPPQRPYDFGDAAPPFAPARPMLPARAGADPVVRTREARIERRPALISFAPAEPAPQPWPRPAPPKPPPKWHGDETDD